MIIIVISRLSFFSKTKILQRFMNYWMVSANSSLPICHISAGTSKYMTKKEFVFTSRLLHVNLFRLRNFVASGIVLMMSTKQFQLLYLPLQDVGIYQSFVLFGRSLDSIMAKDLKRQLLNCCPGTLLIFRFLYLAYKL